MLETVKACIADLEDVSFREYFVRYIMKVQDENIEQEIAYIKSHNNLNIHSMSKLIQTTYEELVNR